MKQRKHLTFCIGTQGMEALAASNVVESGCSCPPPPPSQQETLCIQCGFQHGIDSFSGGLFPRRLTLDLWPANRRAKQIFTYIFLTGFWSMNRATNLSSPVKIVERFRRVLQLRMKVCKTVLVCTHTYIKSNPL